MGGVPVQRDGCGGGADRWLVICLVTVVATLATWAVLYRFSGVPEQEENMRLARQHLPKVRPLLDSDVRFAKVTPGDYTGEGGGLGLFGYVRTEADLGDLRRAVEGTSPPVKVIWGVKVVGPELFDELSKE